MTSSDTTNWTAYAVSGSGHRPSHLVRRSRTTIALGFVALMLALFATVNVEAATEFGAPGFRTAYYAGESLTPNFWGPLGHASDPRTQSYTEASGGQRTVQYFDKGRMELTNGQVTFGLLATELVTGRIQVGNNDFIPQLPSRTPVAGDEDGTGPSYLTIYENRAALLDPKPVRTGLEISALFDESNRLIITDPKPGSGVLALTGYDATTKHNVIAPFTNFRNLVGFSTVGLAISEPFAAYFTVGGVQRAVAVQVFERRILTYTEDNPALYKVEMGNIGRHYFYWRNS
jgi:hypothetical protein